MLEKIAKWHAQGLWTGAMVRQAAGKGVLTQAQADEILALPAQGGGNQSTESEAIQ